MARFPGVQFALLMADTRFHRLYYLDFFVDITLRAVSKDYFAFTYQAILDKCILLEVCTKFHIHNRDKLHITNIYV